MSSEVSHQFVIVGAGFGGLSVARELKKRNIENFIILDRNDEAGGVWKENIYPGVECDIHSHFYCFNEFRNPNWSREFASGSEIQNYLAEFARHFDIERHIRFGQTVKTATYDETTGIWEIKTERETYKSRFFVSAIGQQNSPKTPEIPGLKSFKGKSFHSARWDEKCNLKGKRVALVGSAASAVQIAPEVAQTASKLFVFQRTPSWVIPKPNREIPAEERATYASSPQLMETKRLGIKAFWEGFYSNLFLGSKENLEAEAKSRQYMESQVTNPALRQKLIPNYPFLTKRVILSNTYLATFQRSNVELVTEKIEKIDSTAITDSSGKRHEVDVIIFATGFNSTHFLSTIDVRGRKGKNIQQVWQNGLNAEAYLGTFVNGFPNMFVMFGPNTGVGGTSMTLMLEAQARLIGKCVDKVHELNLKSVEVKATVQDKFNKELHEFMKQIVWTSDKADSWFKTSEGKVTVKWPHQTEVFEQLTSEFKISDYQLEDLSAKATPSRDSSVTLKAS
jgi:cation diffusion facilitator CzcD-associated flavoprotein CzcO